MKLSELVRSGVELLRMSGIEGADLDVELIVGSVLDMEREMVIAHSDDVVFDDKVSACKELFERRKNHEPLAYIIGKKAFFGHDYFVTPDVLIPRGDSEVLVHCVLDMEKVTGEHQTMVEVGVGRGAVLLSIARYLPYANLVGVDISDAAIAVAQKNQAQYPEIINVEFRAGPYLQMFTGQADYIVANLPYIATAQCNQLPPTVKDFEPRLALDGGEDGLQHYRNLLLEVPEKLASDGWVFMEMDPYQIDSARLMVKEYMGEGIEFRTYQDLSGRNRVLGFRRDVSKLSEGVSMGDNTVPQFTI